MSERFKKLNPIESFQLFCLESYRSTHGIPAIQAFNEFKKNNVFSFLQSGYDVLHTQSLKYIISEIDQLIHKQNATLPRKHRNNQEA